jgi:hypothetical protein
MKPMLITVLAAICLGFLGCGGSNGSQGTAAFTAATGNPAIAAPDNDDAICGHGKIFLVGGAGGVGFRARCATAQDLHAPVKVVLAISTPGVEPEGVVKGYRTRAMLTGDGRRTAGSCSLQRDVLVCGGRRSGEFDLSGRFRVRAADRCAIEVTMSATLPPRCNADQCLTDLKSRVLYEGPPRGCAELSG